MPTNVPFDPVITDPAPAGWYDELLTSIMARSNGLTRDFTNDAAVHVIDMFLRRTTLWREETEPVALLAGDDQIVVQPVLGIEPVGVFGVALDGVPLRPLNITGRSLEARDGTPIYFRSISPRHTILWPKPTDSVPVVLTIAASIDKTDSSTVYPSVLTNFREYLIAGIEGDLFLLPNRPWTDQTVAATRRRHFNVGVQTGRTQAYAGFSPGAQTWIYPTWAG
jgi:hypothetical protein